MQHRKEKQFRQGHVVMIKIPSLGKRQEDILILALSFLDYFNRKFAKDVGPFTPDAIAALENAYWAGNMRELRDVVERAVVLRAEGPINPEDLGMSATYNSVVESATQSTAPLPYRRARERFEQEYFENLLKMSGGNVSEVARLSGISRQNLYPYFNRLGILKK